MNRRSILVLFVCLLGVLGLGSLGCSRVGAASPGDLKPLTIDQVAARLATNDGKTFVYDNNSMDSWKQAHVPGAKWLDDENVQASDLPSDKSATLIFYCHNEL
jgi:hypothetical protein